MLLDGVPSGSMPLNDGDALTLGRAPECNIRIRVSSVSKLSARLIGEGTTAYFVNETATNPATLTRSGLVLPTPQGSPIHLEQGDSLRFATRDFLFEYGAWRGTTHWRGRDPTCSFPTLPLLLCA